MRSASSDRIAPQTDGGPSDLAGVRHRPEPAFPRHPEGIGELLRRRLVFDAAEPHAHDAAVAVADRELHDRGGLVGRGGAVEVRRQAHLDAELLARLLHAVAVPLEHRLEQDAVPRRHRRREDRLDVHGAVPRRLLGVVERDAAKVVGRLQGGRHEEPDVDEVREVGERVELLQLLRGLAGELHVVALRDLEQRSRPDGALEMDVELDLRIHRRQHDLWFGRSLLKP